MPDGPSSTAIDFVRWLIAALDAPYTLSMGAERIVSPELTCTITPPRPAATIARASAAEQSRVAIRFWSTIVRT